MKRTGQCSLGRSERTEISIIAKAAAPWSHSSPLTHFSHVRVTKHFYPPTFSSKKSYTSRGEYKAPVTKFCFHKGDSFSDLSILLLVVCGLCCCRPFDGTHSWPLLLHSGKRSSHTYNKKESLKCVSEEIRLWSCRYYICLSCDIESIKGFLFPDSWVMKEGALKS